MNQEHQYIYLHGFASSPRSRKAVYLQTQFAEIGINLEVPDLNKNDFRNLTLTRQINQAKALFNSSNLPITIIGSSFGAYTATWLAEQYSQVEKLVLLAPAFGFPANWLTKLPPTELEEWKIQGYKKIYHFSADEQLPLNYEFLIDGDRYKLEDLKRSLPTLIIHGTNDQVVPIELSQNHARSHQQVELVEMESDHGLSNMQEKIWQLITKFC